jgi:hypothetical protein
MPINMTKLKRLKYMLLDLQRWLRQFLIESSPDWN